MRIGIALVIISDLVIRAGDLTAHYTDEGMWPLRTLHLGWKTGGWSIHTISGSSGYIAILFGLHFLFALLLLAGYRTRLVTIVLWLFTVSLHNRNLFIQQAGDDLLRLVLFWGMFLPWGTHFSVDARRNERPLKIFFGGFGYLMLIASVYLFSVLLKTSPEWWREGTATYYALGLEQLRLPAGDILYQHPRLLRCITWFVIAVEAAVPFLILWPSRHGRWRLAAFVLLVILHLGIGLTLYVGLFYIIGIITAIGLLPTFIFDRLLFPGRTKRGPYPKNKWLTVAGAASAFIIVLCLLINLASLPAFKYTLKKELATAVNTLRLDQHWGMFSPGILKKDGWFVYYGSDSIGRQWDLRTNSDYVDFSKPQHIVKMYKNDRWRKLAENMQNDNFNFLRPLYCTYILKQWNKAHPEKKIITLDLYFMEKESLKDYRTSPVKKDLYCVCYEP